MRQIKAAAVIGAGIMGAGIAAQIANAGVPVLLLDISREIAAAAVEKLLKNQPPAFMHPGNAKLLTTGSIAEDLARISSCDWIVEAVVEKLEVKRALYGKIAAHRRDDAIVSSNTSTIPLSDLIEDAGLSFRHNFLITHFFNPPRHMRLLEIVAGPATDSNAVQSISQFADVRLGKSIVHCKDRPGFIANRLGCFWMQTAIATAFEQAIAVEDADAVMGKPFGIPKTGIFGLADLVGIDLMPHVNASMARALEPGDLFHSVNVPLPFLDKMISQGLIGRKGKGGFYRINREQVKRKEAIDLATGAYRPVKSVHIDDSTPLLLQDNAHGRYGAAVMVKTLAYAAGLVGDAADDIESIDEAMRLGYNWTWGPFELIDRIGAEPFRKLLQNAGLPVAPILDAPAFYRNGSVLAPDGNYAPIRRPDGVMLLADIKRAGRPLLRNESASLWDIGEAVTCFELTAKMNTIDAAVFDLLNRAIDFVAANRKAMVIYSDVANFSAGVNLNWLLAPARAGDVRGAEKLVDLGQQTFKRLKYAPFPGVAAPAGLALGGGCELLLHCSAIQAHAESYIGLVEAGVGILPGWGGCGEMLSRWQLSGKLPKGPVPAIAKVFEIISMATVSKSAAQARELLFLRPGDGITMNRDRLLCDARAKAVSLAKDYRSPEKPVFNLPGQSARVALNLGAQNFQRLGKASAHDITVAGALATVLSGGETDITRSLGEDALLAVERTEVLKLAQSPLTLARIEHMLATGKPLRN
jgi:3-hydroxyacyl-CoA dehydrogenase